MKFFLFFVLIFLQISAHAAEERLKFKQIFTEIPDTSTKTLKKSFSRESIPYWGAIVGSTALLYQYDEEIYAEAQRKGRDWGIGNKDATRPIVSYGGQELVRFPSDTGSFFYFLGDGWMHAGIGGAFLGVGHFSDDNYAYNSGIMLWHGMVVSTIFNQALKRSFGRESPEVSTHPRGSWKLFPSFNEYNQRTATYDAMPSGHVMTATLTFTIISERYPQYNKYVYPVGGLWISALMFEMVNNGVHWASDYPLGIAMGYIFGKMATKMGKKESEIKPGESSSWNVVPSFNGFYLVKKF
jgi:membrane-associated phospholipid phosphatase